MEAITSRPLLLAGVARMTSHGNQKTLHLTTMHANAAYIKSMIANIQNALAYVRASAEQLPKALDRWWLLLKYVIAKMKIPQIFLPIAVG